MTALTSNTSTVLCEVNITKLKALQNDYNSKMACKRKMSSRVTNVLSYIIYPQTVRHIYLNPYDNVYFGKTFSLNIFLASYLTVPVFLSFSLSNISIKTVMPECFPVCNICFSYSGSMEAIFYHRNPFRCLSFGLTQILIKLKNLLSYSLDGLILLMCHNNAIIFFIECDSFT